MNLDDLNQAIARARNYHTQLIAVVGNSTSHLLRHASSADDVPLINLSLELTERLIDIPSQDRPKAAATVFAALLGEQASQVLLLDHIEILFDRSLAIDPLKLLQNNARNTTLAVAWPGEKSSSSLAYATPSHPEYRSYKIAELGETIVIEAGENIGEAV